MTIKLRTRAILSVPRFGAVVGEDAEWIDIEPQIIRATWERNDHQRADVLTIAIPHRDGGVDPRLIKNAHIAFWLWDANREDFDQDKHLRFVGICTDAARTLDENDAHVEMTFHDYTALFVETRHFPADAIPNWSATLQEAWASICSGVGWYDQENGKIQSSVSALADRLVVRLSRPLRTIGEMVPQRLRAISKPQFAGADDGWKVWQSLIGGLGLVSYIEKDTCVVTEPDILYDETGAPDLLYGSNVLSWRERVDARKAAKGVILYAFDPLRGVQVEAAYPPPGDPRVKTRRGKAVDQSSLNSVTSHYDRFAYVYVDEKTLADRARAVYEERSRQEIEGTIKTADVWLGDACIFDLGAGSPIRVALDGLSYEALRSIGGEAAQVRHLVDRCGYAEDVARLIVANVDAEALTPVYHVRTMRVQIGPKRFEVEIDYRNRIRLS